MNMKLKVASFLLLSLPLVQPISAQQGTVSSGGDIYTQDGSIAFSIGVVAYVSINGETTSITHGIQQPYPFSTVGTQKLYWNNTFRLYPNPANQLLYLQLSEDENTIREMDLSARIYDLQGNLVLTQKLQDDINTIWIGFLPPSIYFIQFSQANSFVHSTSFTKTN